MGSKKGHRQFKTLRHQLHNSEDVFLGYPHRSHRTKKIRTSGISKTKQEDHYKSLEEEMREL